MSTQPTINFFEKYLSIWVLLCIVAGIAIGSVAKERIHVLSDWNIATVNVPVAILVWLMIFPMMVQIDFSSLKNVSRNWKGLGLTVVVNWLHQTLHDGTFHLCFLSFYFQGIYYT
jgi:ACR3 family arsenite transporter